MFTRERSGHPQPFCGEGSSERDKKTEPDNTQTRRSTVLETEEGDANSVFSCRYHKFTAPAAVPLETSEGVMAQLNYNDMGHNRGDGMVRHLDESATLVHFVHFGTFAEVNEIIDRLWGVTPHSFTSFTSLSQGVGIHVGEYARAGGLTSLSPLCKTGERSERGGKTRRRRREGVVHFGRERWVNEGVSFTSVGEREVVR